MSNVHPQATHRCDVCSAEWFLGGLESIQLNGPRECRKRHRSSDLIEIEYPEETLAEPNKPNPGDPSATPPASCPDSRQRCTAGVFVDIERSGAMRECGNPLLCRDHPPRCSLCGSSRIIQEDNTAGACSLIGCNDPLYDYRAEHPEKRLSAPSVQQGAAPAQAPEGATHRCRVCGAYWNYLDTVRLESLTDYPPCWNHPLADLVPIGSPASAPTPEYVAGWLAGRDEARKRANATLYYLLSEEHLGKLDEYLGALAPPSAPPVSAPPDMVENTAPAAYCHGCGRALGKEEVHCDDCADELREDETSQNGTAVSDDRLLLLKALVARKAVMHTDCRPDIVAIEGGGVGLVCRIDPEGFPTLSPELRAALTEATK